MATIREIASACGTTKQTVTARLRDLGLWEHVSKDGNAYSVDDFAASAVADSLKSVHRATGGDSAAVGDRSAMDAVNAAIEALRTALSASQAQISVLSRELDAKNAQIAELQSQLADARSDVRRLSSRSWLDRLLGRALPPARPGAER